MQLTQHQKYSLRYVASVCNAIARGEIEEEHVRDHLTMVIVTLENLKEALK